MRCMSLMTFKEFLEEQVRFLHPYYKASNEFKKSLSNDFDKNQRSMLINKIQEFKNLKTLNPQDLIKQPNWKDHALRGILSNYYEAHLVYGQISLIYYHGGRYILLMDIVLHKVLTSPTRTNSLEISLMHSIVPLKKYVEDKLSKWDKNNQ